MQYHPKLGVLFYSGALAALCSIAGCAAPLIAAPTTPIPLPRIVAMTSLESVSPAPRSVPPHIVERSGEVALAESAFDPELAPLLRAYLDRELGPTLMGRPLTISRIKVLIKVIDGVGDVSQGAAGIHVPRLPGAPAGAGIVGLLVGSAFAEAVRAAGQRAVVLASVEGNYDNIAFAGFSFAAYEPERAHACIEDTLIKAFSLVVRSLRSRLPGSASVPIETYKEPL